MLEVKVIKAIINVIILLTSTVLFGQIDAHIKRETVRLELVDFNNCIQAMIEMVYRDDNNELKNPVVVITSCSDASTVKITFFEKDVFKWYSKDVYDKIKGFAVIDGRAALICGSGFEQYFQKTENTVDISHLNFGANELEHKKQTKLIFRPIIDPIVYVFSIREDGFKLMKKDILHPF